MTPKAILGEKKKNIYIYIGRYSCSHLKRMGNGKGTTEGKKSVVENLFKDQSEDVYFPSISGQ